MRIVFFIKSVYQDWQKRSMYSASYRKLAQDEALLNIAEEGMDDYYKQLQR